MTEADRLMIWAAERRVGELRRNGVGLMGFTYAQSWIDDGGYAISCSLPLERVDFTPESHVAHRYFANLLPEGTLRQQIVRDLMVPDTDFDLLRAIGGECAGALSILPLGRELAGELRYSPLSDGDLIQLARRSGRSYTTWSTGQRPRLSLAGSQAKCPVLVRDGRYFLPQGEAPSSHILKFEPEAYRNIPVYEVFTTHLADAIGLPVVETVLQTRGKIRYVVASRYDRVIDEHGMVHRLHQEDFCQALGYGHGKKYQEYGGPTFGQCCRLLRDVSSEPALDLPELIRWQIFNVLSGNSDGHAKNISLLHLPDGTVRLAPFYDLVCTRAVARIDPRLAFSVGGERDPARLTGEHWQRFAGECDVSSRLIRDLLKEIAERLQADIGRVRDRFEERFGACPILQRVEQVVAKQLRVLRRSF